MSIDAQYIYLPKLTHFPAINSIPFCFFFIEIFGCFTRYSEFHFHDCLIFVVLLYAWYLVFNFNNIPIAHVIIHNVLEFREKV